MNQHFFHKQSSGYAALASVRDWAIVLLLAACVLGLAAALLQWSSMEKGAIAAMLGGAFAGMLPAILPCLPVHGAVRASSRHSLDSFLKSIKFTRMSERDGTRVYTQNTSRWMRWDSNCVTVVTGADGQLRVTMPVYCYRLLNKVR